MQKTIQNIPKIRVIVRKRPLSKKQLSRGEKDIVEIKGTSSVIVKEEKVKVDLTPFTDKYQFNFDAAFNQYSSNQQIYVSTVRPLIDAAYDGARVSCFAYGQTGSGKTYTMLGDGNQVKGLYILAAKDVFDLKSKFQGISVWISFYEIYCGKLYDLLNQRAVLQARQDAKNNINIVGLSQRKIQSISQVVTTIQYGSGVRVTSQNSTNVDSSRSHAILQISLKRGKKIHGKISFIDLAGSQRAADHADQTDKQTRIDGAEINKSLLALKECIRALDQNKNHTPFRGSKLTMVLRDSFTGYCKTIMIGNISPNSSSCQNTLNTLKYADRVKQLKKPTNTQLMPNDYLNDLSKQLMLPRQLVKHQHIDHQPKHSHSQSQLLKNNYFKQINQNKVNIFKNQQPKNKGQVTVLDKNSSVFLDKNESGFNQNSSKKLNYSTHKNSSENQKYLNNLSSSKDESPQQIYDKLNQRHQQLLQKVISEQQNLLYEHQLFINQTVQTVNQHVVIMKQADRGQSTIQGYLNKLDSNLQVQLQRIYKLKSRIQNLKYNLDQSKKVQQLYLAINQQSQNTNTNSYNNNSVLYRTPIHQRSQFYNQDVQINMDDEDLLFE